MIPCFLHPGKYCEKYLSHKQDPPFHLFPKTIKFHESEWGIICMPINTFMCLYFMIENRIYQKLTFVISGIALNLKNPGRVTIPS